MHPETKFRIRKVMPFLKKLRHTTAFPIQQLAIVGDPDYLLCSWGNFIGLELKVDDVPRPLQRKKLNDIVKCGGIAIVATPENWAQVADWLRVLDATRKVLPWQSL